MSLTDVTRTVGMSPRMPLELELPIEPDPLVPELPAAPLDEPPVAEPPVEPEVDPPLEPPELPEWLLSSFPVTCTR
jgi:hypothetical protein